MSNQKTRNLLVLQLSLTNSTINTRQNPEEEIDNLIRLFEVDLKKRQ